MASRVWAPGPIEHYVKFRSGLTSYLGTAVLAPEVEKRPAYVNIQSDLGGRSVPFCKVWDGMQHVITTTLGRFDLDTYRFLSQDDAEFDVDLKTDRGSLVTGAFDVELILVNTFAQSGVMPSPYPVGRRYYSCVLLGARESTIGSRTCEVSLIFEANGLFNASDRSFSLFTENATAVLNGLPTPT